MELTRLNPEGDITVKKLISILILAAAVAATACNHRGPTSPDPTGPVAGPVVTGDPQPPVPPAPEPEPPVAVPTPAPVPPPPPVEEPEEEDDDEPQAPAPAPKPTPTPNPTPAPAPQWDGAHYNATTSYSHWTNGAVLPATFTVTLDFSARKFYVGPLWAMPMQQPSNVRDQVIYRDNSLTITVNANGSTGSWTFNGVAGTAHGTLSRK